MLAKKLEETLLRHRELLLRWSVKYHFEAPPTEGGWEEMHAYEDRNAGSIHEADINEEIEQVRAVRR